MNPPPKENLHLTEEDYSPTHLGRETRENRNFKIERETTDRVQLQVDRPYTRIHREQEDAFLNI